MYLVLLAKPFRCVDYLVFTTSRLVIHIDMSFAIVCAADYILFIQM